MDGSFLLGVVLFGENIADKLRGCLLLDGSFLLGVVLFGENIAVS